MDFIESWVHEIKVPLSAINLLLDSSLEKSKEDIINAVEDETYKIDNYVEQVLYYSRLKDFSNDYLLKELSLEKLIKNLVRKNAKYFIERKVSIDLKNLNYDVLSDSKWLSYILNQIIINAIKYSKDNSKIEIYAESHEKGLKLIVTDYGIGIPKEDIARVFDKGFTGKNGRISSNSKSTGMGLYLSKSLAKKLGHDIEIVSKEKKYTKVSINFPKLNNFHDVI